MRPVFSIAIDGVQDATEAIRERFLSLSLVDESGVQADSAELRLDDRGGIPLPRRGAAMQVSLGSEGGPRTVAGSYVVDEIELSSPPAAMTVRAKAVDTRESLKAHKTRSWDDISLGDLAAAIAADHGLRPRVGRSLEGLRIPHLDQADESDLHLLTRLAEDYDAIAKLAGGRLLFVPRGQGETASGERMPELRIAPGDAGRWRVTIADRPDYASARAHWQARGSGVRMTETAGSGEPAYTLRALYASSSQAAEAARSKLAALRRAGTRLSVTLRPGRPEAAAEGRLDLAGFRPGIDGSWICERVVHRLGRAAYETVVEATLEAV